VVKEVSGKKLKKKELAKILWGQKKKKGTLPFGQTNGFSTSTVKRRPTIWGVNQGGTMVGDFL